MKKVLYIFVFAAFASCTEPIDIDVRDAEQTISIYSAIDDSLRIQRVYVTHTRPFFTDEPAEPAANAREVIVIKDDRDTLKFKYQSEQECYVSQSEFAAEAGHKYTLSVKIPDAVEGGVKEYTATSFTPEARSLDSVKIIKVPLLFGTSLRYMISLWLTDPPEPDFYLVYVTHNGILRGGELSEVQNYRDNYPFNFNGQQFNAPLLDIFNSFESWEEIPEQYREDSYYFAPGDTINVQLAHIEKGYLEFVEQCQSSTYGSNPMMGGQPSNITTNISNGAVGYFTTYCLGGTAPAYVPE